MTRRSPGLWMAAAFILALSVAAAVLALRGTGATGIGVALRGTARLSFLLFWPTYVGGPLTTLFGERFLPMKRHGREFGLAFAAAQAVHVGLVAWLYAIGAGPGTDILLFFGTALVFTYLLALLSIDRLRQLLGPTVWWLLRVVGMNYIALAFARDFLRGHPLTRAADLMPYGPFLVLSLVGLLLNLAALTLSIPWGSVLRRTRMKSVSR